MSRSRRWDARRACPGLSRSVNVDLIHGLPGGPWPRAGGTVAQIHGLRRSRGALRPAAPASALKPQRRIVAAELPEHGRTGILMLSGDHAEFPGGRLRLHRDGPLRAARRPRGSPSGGAGCIGTSGATARSRTATDRPGRVGDQQGRCDLCSERQDVGGTTTASGRRAAGGARFRAEPGGPAPPLGHAWA